MVWLNIKEEKSYGGRKGLSPLPMWHLGQFAVVQGAHCASYICCDLHTSTFLTSIFKELT